MKNLSIFIPLAKADAAQRLVFGYFDETPDRAREVFDYASSKANFESWSAEMLKASDGKSLGNIREQHGKVAAGKLVKMDFDDANKRIEFCAKIVDDSTWAKVEEGVITGFSPGGRYAKRWQDGSTTRYTAMISELSVVDVPCNPSAGFTLVKADGVETEVEFVMSKAYEPGNEATKARADELAKAAGDTAKAKDFLFQARADLISENATAELAKMHAGEQEAAQADETAADAAPDPIAALDAAMAKADAAIAGAAPAADADAVAVVLDVPAPFADLAKASAALALIGADDTLEKGLYCVRTLSSLLSEFGCLQADLAYEAKREGDGSAAPGKAAAIMKSIGELLVSLVQEEVAELLAGLPADTAVVVNGAEMELAQQIVDLVKSNEALMEKAGARNSKGDAKRIQQMHDNAVDLGAQCQAAMAKAAELEDANAKLAKAVEAVPARVEAMAKTIDDLVTSQAATADALAKANAQIEELSNQPATAKGALFRMSKSADGSDESAAPAAKKSGSFLDEINAIPAGPQRANAILRKAGQISF